MEPHVSWVTQIANHYFGHAALALLSALHIQPNNPATPIPEYIVMEVLVLMVGTLLALLVKSRISVGRPGAVQQCAEFLITNPLEFGIRDLLDENTGHHAHRFMGMVGTIGIFVLLANLFGTFPFLTPPTGNASVPLACASVVFLYFNYHGIRVHGPLGYLKTFTAGVHWGLWLLIFPVEIISTVARLLSLTVRLWANMIASDLIYSIFLGILTGGAVFAWAKSPILGVGVGALTATIPVLFIALHVFVSFIQAYIFTVLPAVYLGLATSKEH
jgi:F-type H+-transporting ATPase subunit a